MVRTAGKSPSGLDVASAKSPPERWTQLRSNLAWKGRHEHSAYVFKDKIWVAGGHAQPLCSEVWSLEIPEGWFNPDSPDEEPESV